MTFRSAEGAARFRDAYGMNWLSRTLAPYFGCCTDENKVRETNFFGNWLEVSKAPDPTLIDWRNHGKGTKSAIERALVFFIVMIVLLIVNLALLVILKEVEKDL